MNYKNPFECKECPESEKGCPCWVEILETNTQTGEERITKDCLFRLMPRLMIEVIKASNRPAAAIEVTRTEIVNSLMRGFGALVSSIETKALPKNGE